jgi:predicted dehydrogenase
MIRIGVVGAGIIGASHKKAILGNSECILAAACDLDVEKARAMAEGTDARVYTDYRVMAESEELDAVILNLPHFLHAPVSVYFLEKGIAVLVEKPMANTVAECDEMIAASKKSGAPLAVGHVQRYFNAYRALREIIASGKLGKLCQITETRNINYFPNRPAWFLDKKKAGGGIIMNYGAHTLDKVFYATGLEVESVAAAGNNFLTDDTVEATAQMLVRFCGGVSGVFSYSGTHGPSYYQTDFYFTDGVVRITKGGAELWIAEGPTPLTKVELEPHDLFRDQLAEFVKLMRGESSEVVTPDYGRRVIKVLEDAVSQF